MRLALIDGSNLYKSAEALHFQIDFKKLHAILSEDGKLLRACYFTALRDKSIPSQLRKRVDWLGHNGYDVVSKPTQEYTDAWGKTHIKGNVDTDIVVEAYEYAEKVTEIYLFSGDGDFISMVRALQRRYALKVYVVAATALASPDLRKQADKFICLSALKQDIERVK